MEKNYGNLILHKCPKIGTVTPLVFTKLLTVQGHLEAKGQDVHVIIWVWAQPHGGLMQGCFL
jgi:hypothetical protein